jgi:hypothetical protein
MFDIATLLLQVPSYISKVIPLRGEIVSQLTFQFMDQYPYKQGTSPSLCYITLDLTIHS